MYYGHFTDIGVDRMPVKERELHYERLADRKRQERDEQERAAQKAREKRG